MARTLDVIGDWSLLIVRDAFDGVTRFSEFQKGWDGEEYPCHPPARPRDARRGDRARRRRQRLSGICATEKGRALFPVIVGLRQWGRSSVRRGRGALNAESDSGRPVPRLTPIGSTGQTLTPLNTRW